MKISETGRSMVEMLGVLAIMGVLTVGVMLGYRYAMDRILTNSIITGVRARSVIIGQQRVLGQPLNLSEFHPDTEKDLIYGRFEVKAFNNYVYDGEESQAMEVYNIPRRVCENIRMLTFPDETITLVNRSDMGECLPDGPRGADTGLTNAQGFLDGEYHNVVTFIFAGLGEACSINQDCQEGLCCVRLEEGDRGCLPCESPTDCDQCQEWNGETCVNKAEGTRCLWTPGRDGCCTAGVCGACPDRCDGNTCDRLCQTCNSATGECVNHTDGTGCGVCKRCENGACVPDLTQPGCTKCHADTDCSGGTCCCADGTCSADCCNTKCDADTDCSGGACCCTDGTCSADCCNTKCHADTDCSGGACCCADGTCSADCCDTKCHADTDCSGGTCCCADGTCSADCCDTKCHADTDCSGGACCCADGTCSADCCTTKCDADTDCSGGTCCCADGTCSADCCTTKCHADTDCSGGTCCCTDGTCSADCCGTPCTTDENCHFCEQCTGGRCVPNDDKGMCPLEGTGGCAMCQGGQCVKRPTKPRKLCNGKIDDCCLYYDNSCEDETGCCTSDAQCDKEKCMKCDPTLKKCNQYKKWVRDCNGNLRTCCQDDETCKDGVCVIKCATDADCGAGNTCCSGVCVLAGSGSQCCGGRIVSADLECCGGRIVDKEKGDECCGGKNLCTNGQWCDGKECAGKMTCISNGMMNPHRGDPGYVSVQKCCQTDKDCTTLEKSSDCPFKCELNKCVAHKKSDDPCYNCNSKTGEKEPLSVGYHVGKCLVCRMVNGQITAVDTTSEGCCWNDEMCQNRNNDKCLRCTSQEETIVGTCVQKDDYEKCSCEANQKGTWTGTTCCSTAKDGKDIQGTFTEACCKAANGTWEDNKCSFNQCKAGAVWDTSDEAKAYGRGTHISGEGACCPYVAWIGTVCCDDNLNYWTQKETEICAKDFCEEKQKGLWTGTTCCSTAKDGKDIHGTLTEACCSAANGSWSNDTCCSTAKDGKDVQGTFTEACCSAANGTWEDNKCLFKCDAGYVWDTSEAAKSVNGNEGECCPENNWKKNEYGTECCMVSMPYNWWSQSQTDVCVKVHCEEMLKGTWTGTICCSADKNGKDVRGTFTEACCKAANGSWSNDTCCSTAKDGKDVQGTFTEACCKAANGTWADNKCLFNMCADGEYWDTSNEAKNYASATVPGVGSCCPNGYWNGTACCSDEKSFWTGKPSAVCVKVACERTDGTHWDTSNEAKAYTGDDYIHVPGVGACCPKGEWTGSECCRQDTSNTWTQRYHPACCVSLGGHWDTSDLAKTHRYGNGEGACCTSDRDWTGTECCSGGALAWSDYPLNIRPDTPGCCARAGFYWDTSPEAKASRFGYGKGACCTETYWTGTACCEGSYSIWTHTESANCTNDFNRNTYGL